MGFCTGAVLVFSEAPHTHIVVDQEVCGPAFVENGAEEQPSK
jgi:hypothetical protein